MTSDLALYKFAIFLLGAFAVMLTLTLAFKRRQFFFDTKITDWLGAAFTFALAVFTWALVNVASKQTEILSHTDAALNLAAKAQTDSAQTAEKLRLFTEATERAWIGPNGAVIEGTLETGKPISTAVTYQNTGRQPAYLVITTLPTLVKRDAWNNGVGVGVWPIVLWQNKCMGGAIPPNPVNARVAYPTTGFSAYRLQVYSDDATLAQSDRFLATDEFISGDEIFVFVGCFVYGTPQNTHHSAFCFFFDHKVSDVHNLSYSQIGQRTD
jgi:hypothetical protein